MSTQLLRIEADFLRLPEVVSALQLQEVRSIVRTIETAQKKKFSQSLALSQHVRKAVEWFKSSEGQSKLAEEGITWTTEEFGLKVFGWQKSYLYKLLRTSEVSSEVVAQYESRDEEERSVEGLLKFAKEVEEGTEGGGAETQPRAENVFTLTFKHPEFKVTLKIDDAGQVKTNNSSEQVQAAIEFLNQSLQNL